MNANTIRSALDRAFDLGQVYWQQADSESYSDNKKADATMAKYRAHVEEVCALASSFAAVPAEQPHTDGYWELPKGQGNYTKGFAHEGGDYFATSFSEQQFSTREAAEAFIARVGFVDRNGAAVRPEFRPWSK